MKKLSIYCLVFFGLIVIISSCQKNNELDTEPDSVEIPGKDKPPVSMLEVTKVLNSAEGKFIEFGKPSGTTPQQAMEQTAGWLMKQSNISSASIVDNAFIDIKLKSGVSVVFFLDIKDEAGISINRGGGSGETSVNLSDAFTSKNKIENKKVLLCYPNLEEFYKEDEVKKIVTRLQRSELGLDVTMKDYYAVNPALIQTFGDYGLVIINTHGFKDCFLSGSRLEFYGDTTEADVLENIVYAIGQKAFDDLSSGLLKMGTHIITTASPDWHKKYVRRYGGFTIWIGSEYIRRLPDMPNTIIFSNFCYGGQTNTSKEYPDPIGAAFKSKKLISYYAYNDGKGEAYRVSNSFAKAMEDSVTKALVFDFDSTGNSHLSHKGAQFKDPFYPGYLQQFGAKDYSYKKCGDDFIDMRDANKYKTVCIGNQIWMAENLRYNAKGSLFYNNDPSNGPIYGKLYTWSMIMNGQASSDKVPSGVRGICPEGWHIPSSTEWKILISYLGGDKVAGGAMKDIVGWKASPTNGATNSSGFTAKPGGYENGAGYFTMKGESAYWWTSSIDNIIPDYYLSVTNGHTFPSVSIYGTSPNIYLSCRCVKDKK